MILCITHSQDFYTIDRFFQYLSSKNIPYFRLNSDQLNHLQKISISEDSFQITGEDGKSVSSNDITGVWNRKIWRISVPEELDQEYEKIFLNEYAHLRYNLFTQLQHLPWINPYENEKKVDGNKMFQLKVAKRNHLTIPPTVFTNDEEKVKAFFEEHCSGKAIAKLHGVIRKTMSGENLISTMVIEQETLENLSGMIYCPMIFQPYINKEYELRIMYVDGEFYTGKINNSENADWRVSHKDYFWTAYELPADIRTNLTSMMKEMGLYTGAIDMIRGKDGKYYFLEVNPQGEWGMLQKELGFPIAERIADNLIKRINIHE
ncbi:ATP-grasp ribosomal peptide maturase [Chryseobacterium bernardetii]|uniref:ATP-grasp ribosomal peptide maturase n=1 Tax=Chryseobacterium bernardetii TaxID=1241978 RepID=A0A3G6TDE4_9FLAO|nr:ATP-grasp ribosomal peptide maturase [Chryseobacterium bernardetii]AZB27222.1 ATP-grasp ribosomal peptide maturase [Chryseobacterium bernardetii]